MGEHDWLERGHGGGESLQPMIKGSAAVVAVRASIRSVLRGTDVPMAPRRPTRRRTKALVGWMLYCCTAVGGTAAAFTVRDTLFPSLGGSPTAQPLWGDRPVESTPATDASTSSAKTDSTVTESTVVATTVATTRSSTDEQSADSTESQSGKGTNTTSTVDDHGNGDNGPVTGTTVVEAADDPGTTVTTVDDHGPNTSTAPTASNPGSSVDPTPVSASTPASPPASPPDTGNQNGKGGGSGGGGGGSSGGPPPSP